MSDIDHISEIIELYNAGCMSEEDALLEISKLVGGY